MGTNKSPGLDGCTVEFLKLFWQDLGIILHRVINEAYIEGEFSVTLKRRLITCIPKANKDTISEILETNHIIASDI